MGCRICVEAPLDTMPLDLAILLRTPPASTTFFPTSFVDYSRLVIDTQPKKFSGRRAATFPLSQNRGSPVKASNLKNGSLSQLNNLKIEPNFVTLSLDSDGKYRLVPNEKSISIDHKWIAGNLDDKKPIDGKPMIKKSIDGKMSDRKSIADRSIDDQSIDTSSLENSCYDNLSFDQPISEKSTPQHGNFYIVTSRSDCGFKKYPKKVAFADDRGMQLTMIKVMTEPSDVPPKLDYPAIMKSLFGEDWMDEETVAKPCATWIVNFKQPASEYAAFRQKLDKNFVSLENVLVKNDRCRLFGTIKVKNICFQKNVFIRFTENDWRTFYDHPCKFVSVKNQAESENPNFETYDTFQFDFGIPYDDKSHQKMEFCVCYKTEAGEEYWDNNDGKNYEIISEHLRVQRNQTPTLNGGNNCDRKPTPNFVTGSPNNSQILESIKSLNSMNWTEFASWKDFPAGAGTGCGVRGGNQGVSFY